MKQYDDARQVIENLTRKNKSTPIVLEFLDKRKKDLDALVPSDFFMDYSEDDWDNLMRYIRTIKIRTERGCQNLGKDRLKEEPVIKFQEAYNDLVENLSPVYSEKTRKAISELGKMIEEYKISIFAQEIKTLVPVSPKRLMEKIGEIRGLG